MTSCRIESIARGFPDGVWDVQSSHLGDPKKPPYCFMARPLQRSSFGPPALTREEEQAGKRLDDEIPKQSSTFSIVVDYHTFNISRSKFLDIEQPSSCANSTTVSVENESFRCFLSPSKLLVFAAMIELSTYAVTTIFSFSFRPLSIKL